MSGGGSDGHGPGGLAILGLLWTFSAGAKAGPGRRSDSCGR